MADHGEDEPRRLSVTIIGGGITGLSAAHELVERGFHVRLIERREHPFEARECQIGGMARTQWSRFPPEEIETRPLPRGTRKARPPIGLAKAADDVEVSHPEIGAEADVVTIPFALQSSELLGVALQRLERVAVRLREYIEGHVARDDDGKPCAPDQTGTEILYIEGYRYVRGLNAAERKERDAYRDEDANLSGARAAAVHEMLTRELAKPLPHQLWRGVRSSHADNRELRYIDYVSLRALDLGGVLAVAGNLLPLEQSIVRVRVAEIALPGEHGYRYFPSFYKHLFDVMKRTPISEMRHRDPEDLVRERAVAAYRRNLVEATKSERDGAALGVIRVHLEDEAPADRWRCVRDGRMVFDNLVSADLHSIARDGDDGPAVLSRRKATSLKEVLDFIRVLQERLHFEQLDLARYQLKLIQYMTSCASRRGEYSQKSWAQFVDVDTYSDAFKEAMKIWPQALVGMRADEVDARTAGNVTVQILLDQLRDTGLTDATLNGPTSEAWLEPWRRYLEYEGVEFKRAELTRIRWDDAMGLSYEFDSGATTGFDKTDYYVIALPVEVAYDLATLLREDLSASPGALAKWFVGSDFDKLIHFLKDQGWHRSQLEEPAPIGPLRHLSGIQFYLEHDIRLVRGHVYYSDSPWGLTSISQVQFRRVPPDVRDDYRGLISVDVGNWSAPGKLRGLPAWDCSPRQIGDEVWQQVKDGARDGQQTLEEPVWYHIDDEIKFHSDQLDSGGVAKASTRRGVERNESPYLLNRPTAWEARPGGPEEDIGNYGLLFSGAPGKVRATVLAGTFMKTYTRLVTMEAANESARHAVNQILRDAAQIADAGRIAPLCETWPLEDREPADLSILKDLDAKLCQRNLPHLFEILQLDAGVRRSFGERSFASDERWSIDQLLESWSDWRAIEWGSLGSMGAGHEILAALKKVLRQGGWSK